MSWRRLGSAAVVAGALGMAAPNCTGPTPTGKSCDEYPFYASSENKGLNSHPAVALAWVDATANSGVGGRLGSFYQGCNIRAASAPMVDDGGLYGVVPVPPGAPIDTTYICAPAPAK